MLQCCSVLRLGETNTTPKFFRSVRHWGRRPGPVSQNTLKDLPVLNVTGYSKPNASSTLSASFDCQVTFSCLLTGFRADASGDLRFLTTQRPLRLRHGRRPRATWPRSLRYVVLQYMTNLDLYVRTITRIH
jgi:hypothetical protein